MMTENAGTFPRRDGERLDKRAGNWKLSLLICVLIVFGGTIVVALIYSTEPEAVRTEGTRESAMLVEITRGEGGSFHPTVSAMGTVVPVRDVILRPQVSGRVVERLPSFTPGGFVARGETLLRIDPADYRHILEQRRSDLRQATADLHIEMGRQEVASKDYLVMGETLSEEKEALVLRRPQLDVARAKVAAAQAAVDQAELDLKRTVVTAPFDAHVLSRNVDFGSQVDSGDALGRMVGIDTYWVEATVPLPKLSWISFPSATNTMGSEVHIRNPAAWPEGNFRTGRLATFIGSLEDRTRMARVLITVDDPLARGPDMAGVPPLMLGSFVQVDITGKVIEDVVRIDRQVVRTNDTVWVMQEDKLDIREVEIVFRDARYAYVTGGLKEDDLLVATNLTTVVEGAPLRLGATNGAAVPQGSSATEAPAK